MKLLPILMISCALALSGCIQNMADLKDRVGAGGEEPVEPAAVVDEQPTTPTPETTAPKVTKPPVARISVFGPNGALVFKSTFQADDPADLIFVQEKSKLNLIGGDSETLEPGATIATYAWTMNGKPVEGGRQASLEIGEAGVYALMLTVTDSHGKSDTQAIKLAVAPKPFEVVSELTSGALVGGGLLEAGDPVDTPFELAAPADKPSSVQAVKILATAPTACDLVLELLSADGTSLGAADVKTTTSMDGSETLELGALALGSYTIRLSAFNCAAQDGVPLTVTVTYLPTIPGLESTDGHGGHAGH